MSKLKYLKYAVTVELLLLLLLFGFPQGEYSIFTNTIGGQEKAEYIKWVDFSVPYEILDLAYRYDVESHGEAVELHWIELLSYLASQNGGKFTNASKKQLNKLAQELKTGETTIEKLTKDLKYYPYYFESYSAVLDGYVGEYEIQEVDKNDPEKKIWTVKYGLKAFSPIAKGYEYQDYDDFGVSRSYGFKRKHLGHDMMGQTGTPIIAIESGYVEILGWNQYGGWRIGIRSFDKKRYYYYAHLRQNFPFNKELKEGSVVQAGDVIGYLGHTGYSKTENVNNIDDPHLHYGIQLIFDESQKEGNNEIWIDCYAITRFLYKNRSQTVKDVETKEYSRIYDMKDPEVDAYLKEKTVQ